jgi:hypothetical protein
MQTEYANPEVVEIGRPRIKKKTGNLGAATALQPNSLILTSKWKKLKQWIYHH